METIKSENSSSPNIYGDDENSDVSNEIQSEVTGEVSVKLGEVDEVKQVKKGDDEVYQRENRLTSIIDQLRCQNKLKGKLKYYTFIIIIRVIGGTSFEVNYILYMQWIFLYYLQR